MIFIESKLFNGSQVLLNLNTITRIYEINNKLCICFDNGDDIFVSDSYTSLKNKILEAQNDTK